MRNDEPVEYYDGTVRIPNEIQKIRDPIFFNLTGRELLFVAIAVLAAAGTALLIFRVLAVRNTTWILLPVAAAAPALCFGFIRPLGLNLEDWLTIWRSNNLQSAPVRKLFSKNEYEKAMELAVQYQERVAQSGRKRPEKRKRRWKKKSAYVIRR
jgi:hypothetical protein